MLIIHAHGTLAASISTGCLTNQWLPEQDEKPGSMALVEDMLRPESLPPGWVATFDEANGRRSVKDGEYTA